MRRGCALLLPLFLSCAVYAKGEVRDKAKPYVPGVGEIMSLTLMRHEKLGLAGLSKNWALANYELDELEEGFEDLKVYHPNFKAHGVGTVSLSKMIKLYAVTPIARVRNAITKKDTDAFRTAYSDLTQACNKCHFDDNKPFIKINEPNSSSFANQLF